MGKKKQNEPSEEFKSRIEKEIAERFGDGLLTSGDKWVNKDQKIVSLSPALDIVSNGGVPDGSWLVISGQPKTGKTTLALSFARNCQQVGKSVWILNVEGRIKPYNLQGIKELDPKKVNIISSTQGNILTSEKWLSIAERLIRDEPGCLIIIDSASALCSEAEMIADPNGQFRSQGPKLMAQFCRRMANLVPVNKTIVFITNHLYANTSGKGKAFIEDGGQKLFYQTDIRLRIQYVEPWKVGNSEDGKIIGQKIHYNLVTSALGGIPGSNCTGFLRYGVGIDEVQENLEIAGSLGLAVRKSGSWFSFEGTDGEVKCQGAEKLYQHFQDNPKDYEKLKDHVRSVFGGLAAV